MKSLKKIGVLLLAAIMLIQSGIVLVSAEETQKDLIYTDQEVKTIVAELCEYGLFDLWVSTETFFTEEASVTRVEAAEALIKLLGYDNIQCAPNPISRRCRKCSTGAWCPGRYPGTKSRCPAAFRG